MAHAQLELLFKYAQIQIHMIKQNPFRDVDVLDNYLIVYIPHLGRVMLCYMNTSYMELCR